MIWFPFTALSLIPWNNEEHIINYLTKWKSFGHVRLFANSWTVALQAPLSTGFPRQEYQSGLPFPSPGHLPDPGIEPRSPALQADSLPSESRNSTERALILTFSPNSFLKAISSDHSFLAHSGIPAPHTELSGEWSCADALYSFGYSNPISQKRELRSPETQCLAGWGSAKSRPPDPASRFQGRTHPWAAPMEPSIAILFPQRRNSSKNVYVKCGQMVLWETQDETGSWTWRLDAWATNLIRNRDLMFVHNKLVDLLYSTKEKETEKSVF